MLIVDFPHMNHVPKLCKDCMYCSSESFYSNEHNPSDSPQVLLHCDLLNLSFIEFDDDGNMVGGDYDFITRYKYDKCPIKGDIDYRWRYMENEKPNTDDYVLCIVADAEDKYALGFWREDTQAWDSCYFGWIEREDLVDNHEAYTCPPGIGKVVKWMPLPDEFQPKKPIVPKDESCPHHDICEELYGENGEFGYKVCPGSDKCVEPSNSFYEGMEASMDYIPE